MRKVPKLRVVGKDKRDEEALEILDMVEQSEIVQTGLPGSKRNIEFEVDQLLEVSSNSEVLMSIPGGMRPRGSDDSHSGSRSARLDRRRRRRAA